MLTYRKWVLTVGIMAVTPGITMAGPFSLFKPKSSATSAQAKTAKKSKASKNTKSNQQMAEDIARALRAAKLKGDDVSIKFDNGVAVLAGQVGSEQQKLKASRLVGRVPGVTRVVNKLTMAGSDAPKTNLPQAKFDRSVQPVSFEQAAAPSLSPVRDAGMNTLAPLPPGAPGLNNQQVAEKIAKALSTASLNDHDIEVRFQGGQAILDGAVSNPKQWKMATHVASRIPGVQSVNNQLKVEGLPAAAQGNLPPHPGAHAPQFGGPPVAPAAFRPGMVPPNPMMMAAAAAQPMGPGPANIGFPGQQAGHAVHDQPNLPDYAWPAQAAYPNYAQVAYPRQYSASAWPYIGPFYPYPQVPLGWRQVQLEWDDGFWSLNHRPRTDRWWWFMHPKNW